MWNIEEIKITDGKIQPFCWRWILENDKMGCSNNLCWWNAWKSNSNVRSIFLKELCEDVDVDKYVEEFCVGYHDIRLWQTGYDFNMQNDFITNIHVDVRNSCFDQKCYFEMPDFAGNCYRLKCRVYLEGRVKRERSYIIDGLQKPHFVWFTPDDTFDYGLFWDHHKKESAPHINVPITVIVPSPWPSEKVRVY